MSPPAPRSAPEPSPLVGVLENVRSMWNVGSIFRSSDGAGVARLFLCGFTAHPPRKEISKTALGAEDTVAWEYWTRAAEACGGLRQDGFRVIALETGPASIPLSEVPVDGPLAFVVGHETDGISEDTRMACDLTAHLPMRGSKLSLNVAVAFALAAYHLRGRQEEPGPAFPADAGT